MAKAWTEQEMKFLFNNYKKFTQQDIAAVLGRTPSSVAWKISDMDLTRELKNRKYTANPGQKPPAVKVKVRASRNNVQTVPVTKKDTLNRGIFEPEDDEATIDVRPWWKKLFGIK